MRTVGTFLVLFALWLLMSGIFSPFLIGLGAASVVLVLWVTRRMDGLDGDQLLILLSPIRFVQYMLWLFVEIARANWAVTKLILARNIQTNQHLFTVRASQTTDLAQVVFANSITLTPGTITVETEPGQFLVHAVDYSDSDLDELAEMDRRVSAIEAPRGA